MRSMILAGLALLAMAVGLLSFASAGSAAEVGVEVGNLYFCDSSHSGQVCETSVTAGDTVTWSVASGSHTVTQCTDETFSSCGAGFNSGTLSTGGTFQQTFTATGTVFYHCAFHPSEMRGKILAAAAATASPTAAATSPGATATAKPSVAAAVNTGGPPGAGDGAPAWAYVLLALGAALAGGSALSYALARQKR